MLLNFQLKVHSFRRVNIEEEQRVDVSQHSIELSLGICAERMFVSLKLQSSLDKCPCQVKGLLRTYKTARTISVAAQRSGMYLSTSRAMSTFLVLLSVKVYDFDDIKARVLL